MILNIQPVAAIDFKSFNALGDRGKMTGEWLVHCQSCSVPELANVFNRAGIAYEFVTGYLDEQIAKASIALDKLVAHHNLVAITYYCEGETANAYENIVTSLLQEIHC